MKKIKLKKIKYKKAKIMIISFVLVFICLCFLFRYINLKASPILLNYAELETKKLISIITNEAVSKNITDSLDVEELFLITKDSNGEIKTIDFNPIVVNKILTKTTSNVQLNLKYIEQGKIDLLDLNEVKLIDYDVDKLRKGIICEIPSGVIFNNAFFSNIGPKIPVKINLDGDVISHINTQVTSYGINNALIEINIILEISARVILPFVSDFVQLKTSIPVALKLIQGSIPNYYLNGFNQNSNSLALPIE